MSSLPKAAKKCVLPRLGRTKASTLSPRSKKLPSMSAGSCRRTLIRNNATSRMLSVLVSGRLENLQTGQVVELPGIQPQNLEMLSRTIWIDD